MRQHLITYFPIVSVAFLIAFFGVALFVPKIRDFAVRIGAVQQGGGRRVHQGAIPNIGGIAIFGGFLIALFAGSLVRPDLLDAYRVELLAIILGGALMTLVGFIDDLWEVSPAMRLGSQFLAAGILVVNGVQIDFITNYFGDGPYLFLPETLAAVVTLLWVVGFTNAFNFIDGLDGLSSGIAAISSLSILAVAVQLPDRGATVLLLAALAGAALGFLRHNFNPAKIIMGDSGAY
ncbi:MAG TPA: MraY family glycosyltransferase, partial [Trueperaceae bacterium]